MQEPISIIVDGAGVPQPTTNQGTPKIPTIEPHIAGNSAVAQPTMNQGTPKIPTIWPHIVGNSTVVGVAGHVLPPPLQYMEILPEIDPRMVTGIVEDLNMDLVIESKRCSRRG